MAAALKERAQKQDLAKDGGEPVRIFLERFYHPVYRYLWQASGSKSDAEDLTSVTLLTALRSISRYHETGVLQAWVFRIAHRQLLMHRRREALAKLVPLRWNQPPCEARDDQIVLSEALTKLPLDHRTAFLLTEVEGLSMEEAATVMGIPPGTVKSRCFHARKKLREILAPAFASQENPS